MPIIRLNARNGLCELHHSAQSPVRLLGRMATLPGPVIVMIHGFSYQPGHSTRCPHRQILRLDLSEHCPTGTSWPRGLGFGTGRADEGLGLAFGWSARGSIWGARRRAVSAGQALARVLRVIGQRAPRRRVHIVAHSMGVEVAAEALHHLPAGAIDRIISMTGACYQSRMRDALQTEAGRRASLINVTTRENDLYDCLYERLIPRPVAMDRALGQGLDAANAVTLQVDCTRTLRHLARLETEIAPSGRRICHRSSYMRPGILQFYACLLRHPERISLDRLRAGLTLPNERRWSRFRGRALLLPPLSLAQRPG